MFGNDKLQSGRCTAFKFYNKLFKMSLRGMNIGRGDGLETSGEEQLIKKLTKIITGTEQAVLFDIGANIGKYTQMLLKYMPNATIHCFEAASFTYERLKENVGMNGNVILNNTAVSDKCGQQKLFYDKEGSGLASLYERQLDYFNIVLGKSELVEVTTIDEYCKNRGIQHIDFLKLDIEGNELAALHGAASLLRDNRIDYIQLEFGGCNIDSRTYFRDFWNLLHDKFSVYRILQDGLWHIDSYSETLEIFTTTNFFFACKQIGMP